MAFTTIIEKKNESIQIIDSWDKNREHKMLLFPYQHYNWNEASDRQSFSGCEGTLGYDRKVMMPSSIS